ncbi:hypothetical protein EELLY_v1c01290 [Entomoplasma ellychniae]|uniref:Lipoprotein n=1 Tax=Entomoplasma ellychniae TaxID=2114 RepID=A0A8E2U9S9_9MOLU|nr:lipoprotein [Entomoplasma ellychniae]PPE04454.1 hypothetical protein EELLY_v1c01290 [Entomoplasma ellychniae]
MKKLLGLLAAAGLVAASTTLVVQCKNDKKYALNVAEVSKTIASKLGEQPFDSIEAVQEQLKKIIITGIKSVKANEIVGSKNVHFKLDLIKGYKIDKQEFELKDILSGPVVTPEVGTNGVQAALDTVIKNKKFSSVEKAIEAAKTVDLAKCLILDGEPTNVGETITIKVKGDTGYNLTEGSKTEFSAEWRLVKSTPIDKDTTIAELEKEVKDQEFATLQDAIDKVQSKKITGIKTIVAEVSSTPTKDVTFNVTVTPNDEYSLGTWDGKTTITIKVPTELEINKANVDNALNIITGPYESNELAINAIKAIANDTFLVVDVTSNTRAFTSVTFTVKVSAKTGYKLAADIENGTSLVLEIGKEDIEINKADVDEVLAQISGPFNNLADAVEAITKIEDSRFKFSEIDYDDPSSGNGYREVTFKIPVNVSPGYKLASDLENGTTRKLWIGNQSSSWNISTDYIQELLDNAVKNQEFADAEAAFTATRTVKFKAGVSLDGKIDNQENTIILNVKPSPGYKFAANAKTSFTATWLTSKIEVSISDVDDAIKAVVNANDVTYGTKQEAKAAIEGVLKSDTWKDKITGNVTTTGDAVEGSSAKGTYSVVLKAVEGYKINGNATISGDYQLEIK